MAHFATDHMIPSRIGHRIGARLRRAWRAVVYFHELTARLNASEALLDASEEELRARGLTRAEVVAYILDGPARG